MDATQTIQNLTTTLQDCPGLGLPGKGANWYTNAFSSLGKMAWRPLLEIISFIGQSQLVRRLLAFELKSKTMLDAPVSLQRALRGLSTYMENKHLNHRGSSISLNSDLEHAANLFSLRDNLHGDVLAEPLGGRDSNATVEDVDHEVMDTGIGVRPSEELEESIRGVLDSARLRLISESMLQSDENSSHNGSEARDSSSSTAGIVRSGEEAMSSGMNLYGKSLGDPMASETELSDNVLGTISEDGLAARLGLLLPADTPEPSSSVGKMGEVFTDGDSGKRGHWRSGMNLGLSGKMPGVRTRRRSGGIDLFHRYSEGSSSARTATSLSNSSFWDSAPAKGYMMQRIEATPSIGSSAGRARSHASSLIFPRSRYSAFEAPSFEPAPSSYDPAESQKSIQAISPTEGGSHPCTFTLLQGTGYLDPMEAKYTMDRQVPTNSIAAILFFTTMSLVDEYDFHTSSASLIRPIGSFAPDSASFVTGLVTLLFQYHVTVTDEFLRYIGQYIRSYLRTATGSVARGMVAAGVDVSLPDEVRRTMAFLSEICKVGSWIRERAVKYIPPCLLDGWVLTVTSKTN